MSKRYRDLADYLQRSGETQVELAERVGVNQSSISLAKNRKSCGFKLVMRIHRATGVPIESLEAE